MGSSRNNNIEGNPVKRPPKFSMSSYTHSSTGNAQILKGGFNPFFPFKDRILPECLLHLVF